MANPLPPVRQAPPTVNVKPVQRSAPRAPRRLTAAAVVVAVVGVGVALSVANRPDAEPIDAVSQTTVSGPPPITDPAPTTTPVAASTPPVADPALVAVCIEFTPVAAFMGQPRYQQLWNESGQDPATLQARCTAMSADDLAQIAQDKAMTDAYLAAAAQTTIAQLPLVTLPVSSAPTSPPPASSALPPAQAPLPVADLPPAPTPAPVVTAAPAPACNPNYADACVPNASDVDCAGGSGNGPAYVAGPVRVIGNDVYGLDSNNDGIGCENS